jgi:hypothetical protein
MAPSQYVFSEERLILCEGDDDKYFLQALIEERGLPRFQVRHTGECSDKGGGRGGFLHALNGIEALTGFEQLKAILLVTDNDEMPKSFNDMRRILKALKLSLPNHPTDVLTICGKPGALLMLPRHDTAGDLETLCWPAIVAKWPNANTCVPQFLKCTGADQWTKPASINKARLRSAIIGNHEKDPYNTLGLLFQRRVLSTAHACFDSVAQFLADFDHTVGI